MGSAIPCGPSAELRIEDIAVAKPVIHPALDWVRDQLIVGVVMTDSKRAVISSTKGLTGLQEYGEVCERDGKFASIVTPEVARAFREHLDSGSAEGAGRELQHLAGQLTGYLDRFVILPEKWWSSVLAAWTIGTYFYPMFQTYPYLWLTSAEPGCGKTLLGQILAGLSFNGELMTSPTEANLFHLPEVSRGVQVWDEFELSTHTEKKRFEALKSILLHGYRNGGSVPRQVGNQWDKTVRYHVYCPRVLIGLSPLKGAALERTIRLGLRKKELGEGVQHYVEYEQLDELRNLRNACVLSALKCANNVNKCYRDGRLRKRLEELLGQAGREVDDIWLPLFSVAAATADTGEVTADHNDWLGSLATAAKELASAHAEEASTPISTATSGGGDPGFDRERLRLATALDILGSGNLFTPEALAGLVSEATNSQVSAQWLSKALKRAGIQARKQNGKRIFRVRAPELTGAMRTLGLEVGRAQSASEGQQGQEGQLEQEEEIYIET